MDKFETCGFSFWRPKWIQQYATSNSFLIVYGILGTFQTMTYMYATTTLTTLEKRFKIPSSMTGFIFSGSEVAHILLSLGLSYLGGTRNRPRWIAWGGVMSAFACFSLASAHFFFGPGDEATQLTEEYLARNELARSMFFNSSQLTAILTHETDHNLCRTQTNPNECTEDEERISVLPLVLIFLTQFVLGVGVTMYISLGTPYLDDGVKRKNTPYMLASTMSFRVFGTMSFLLVNVSLRMYIDPWATPVITQDDPRWLGAWWFGYIILGIGMMFSSLIIGMFPQNLPKIPNTKDAIDEKHSDGALEEEVPLRKKGHQLDEPDDELDGFVVALKKLLQNKLVVLKLIADIFYVLGSTGVGTYFSKYMEVQFNRNAADASIITGPISMVTMIMGFFMSAFVIGKFQPSYRKLALFNTIVGVCGLSTFAINIFLTCDTSSIADQLKSMNLTTECNRNCSCDAVPFTPICDTTTGTTLFSPCHAGCNTFNETERQFHGCDCAGSTASHDTVLLPGACSMDCTSAFYANILISSIHSWMGSVALIGSILMGMRVVTNKEKSFSSGLSMWAYSIFAVIPGRILFGYVIDSTCVVWNYKCGERGNCQLYDQDMFRYYINAMAIFFCALGICCDILSWYYGKHAKLYEEPTTETLGEGHRRASLCRSSIIT